MTQFQRKIDSSHGRLEGMLRDLLDNQSGNLGMASNPIVGTMAALGRGCVPSSMAMDTPSPSECIADVVPMSSRQSLEDDGPAPVNMGEPSEVATDIDVPVIDNDDMLGVFAGEMMANLQEQQCTPRVRSVVTSVGGHDVGTESTEGPIEEGRTSAPIPMNADNSRTEQVHGVQLVPKFVIATSSKWPVTCYSYRVSRMKL